jgi:hypothetical protein
VDNTERVDNTDDASCRSSATHQKGKREKSVDACLVLLLTLTGPVCTSACLPTPKRSSSSFGHPPTASLTVPLPPYTFKCHAPHYLPPSPRDAPKLSAYIALDRGHVSMMLQEAASRKGLPPHPSESVGKALHMCDIAIPPHLSIRSSNLHVNGPTYPSSLS